MWNGRSSIFRSIHSVKCPFFYSAISSNHPGARSVVQQRLESILSPKQHRRSLPSLLYKSFFFVFSCLRRVRILLSGFAKMVVNTFCWCCLVWKTISLLCEPSVTRCTLSRGCCLLHSFHTLHTHTTLAQVGVLPPALLPHPAHTHNNCSDAWTHRKEEPHVCPPLESTYKWELISKYNINGIEYTMFLILARKKINTILSKICFLWLQVITDNVDIFLLKVIPGPTPSSFRLHRKPHQAN